MSEEKVVKTIVGEGRRFREVITKTKQANGKYISLTHHEEKRGGSWVARKSTKSYNNKKN